MIINKNNNKEIIVPFIEGAYYFYNIFDLAIYLCLSHKGEKLTVNIKLYRLPFFINRINLSKIYIFLKEKLNLKSNNYKNFIESDNKNSLYGNFLSNKKIMIKNDLFNINFIIIE
jgi:hypothetical protein